MAGHLASDVAAESAPHNVDLAVNRGCGKVISRSWKRRQRRPAIRSRVIDREVLPLGRSTSHNIDLAIDYCRAACATGSRHGSEQRPDRFLRVIRPDRIYVIVLSSPPSARKPATCSLGKHRDALCQQASPSLLGALDGDGRPDLQTISGRRGVVAAKCRAFKRRSFSQCHNYRTGLCRYRDGVSIDGVNDADGAIGERSCASTESSSVTKAASTKSPAPPPNPPACRIVMDSAVIVPSVASGP